MGDAIGGRVLVVSDELARAQAHAAELARGGVATFATNEVAAACERLRDEVFDAVVADLGESELSCLAVVRSAARAQPPVRVVCILSEARAGTQAGGWAIREAAFACLPHDVATQDIVLSVSSAMEAHRVFTSMRRPADRGVDTASMAGAEAPGGSAGGVSWR
ncbi:MAG: hypothetical protein O2895_03695 [Chloroflexi bacterium]|nr:hypothetical protein [Chloroflexota bacterium]